MKRITKLLSHQKHKQKFEFHTKKLFLNEEIPIEKPIIAQKGPFEVELDEGRLYR